MSYLSLILSKIPFLLLTTFITYFIYNKYARGLNNIPGPWLAGYSNLWRLSLARTRRYEIGHLQLHQKYGDVVRMGPSFVSISDWEAIKKIFAPNSGFMKSDFYPVQQTLSHGKRLQSLFNTTDEKYHTKLRRAIASSFSMSTIVQFEPLVDSTINALVVAIEQRFLNRSTCDFGEWLHFFAFDVIGEMLFSKRLGFVDQGFDIEGIIRSSKTIAGYGVVVGQMPSLDLWLKKNPIRIWLGEHGFVASPSSPVAIFAGKRMAERTASEKNGLGTQSIDLLGRYILEGKRDPDFITERQIMGLTVMSIFAGSDSTATTLRTIFYYVMKQPWMMDKLMAELNDASFDRQGGIISWKAARELPYLTAVVQESLRLFPAVGVPLERVVPAGGLEVCGHFIPAGTVVGVSAWPLHRKESMFGPQPDEFRPERWIDASEDEKMLMNNALFSFGMGSRTCIGKNISLLEIYKLVPTILRKFELSLQNPEAEWETENNFFVKQTGLLVNIRSTGRA